MVRIELHIEELVLNGFPPRERDRLAGAIQAELTRLLTAQGLPEGWQGGPLAVGEVTLGHGSPDRVGTEIAQAIYGSRSK